MNGCTLRVALAAVLVAGVAAGSNVGNPNHRQQAVSDARAATGITS